MPSGPSISRSSGDHARNASDFPRDSTAGSASFAPCSASLRIKGAGSISLRIGEYPETTMPGTIANGRPRLAMACAAEARCSSLNASRLASAAVRRSALEGIAVMRDLVLPSSPAKAGDPVFQRRSQSNCGSRGVLDTRFRGYDERAVGQNQGNKQNESARPRSPLKHSIPEFPTKVGGHHMSGSTDPARDSSLKDR